jgi:hypothetical protein
MSTAETPTVPKVYFVNEVATALRRSTAAVQYLIASGQLKSSKLGGRRVVTQEQLDDFFAEAFDNAG